MYTVVFLSPHSDPQAMLGEPDSGGQCVYEYDLGLTLSQLGVNVITYCRQTGKRADTVEVNERYHIQRISCGEAGFIPKEEISRVLPDFCSQVNSRIPWNEEIILHGHYWDGAYASLYLEYLHDTVPLIWTPHSLGSAKRRTFPGRSEEEFYNFIPRVCWESYASLASTRVIVSSKQEKKMVMTDYLADEKIIDVIPPGIQVDEFVSLEKAKMRRQFGLPLKGKIVLTLGRMTPYKGYHHALDAFASLQKVIDESVYLVICGGSEHAPSKEEKKYTDQLHQQVHDLHLEKKVFFIPSVPHERICEIYSAADIFLMCSEHEPFGLTVLEAMAMRIPLVASNQGGPTNIVLHNQTGCLVDMQRSTRVAGYILSLLKDERLSERMMLYAYAEVRKEYDWKQRAKEFMATYSQAFEDHTPGFSAWVEKNTFLHTNLGR